MRLLIGTCLKSEGTVVTSLGKVAYVYDTSRELNVFVSFGEVGKQAHLLLTDQRPVQRQPC